MQGHVELPLTGTVDLGAGEWELAVVCHTNGADTGGTTADNGDLTAIAIPF